MKTTLGLLLTVSTRLRQMRIRSTGHGAALVALVVLAAATTGASSSPRGARLGQSGRHPTTVLPPRSTATDCSTDSTLCLSEGRFVVNAHWKAPDGSSGLGHPVGLTSESGYFWFLKPDNIDLAVETLNGCGVNGHYWFFSGGQTNLEITMTVTDTTTGETRTYFNPQGKAFQPILDTAASESCTAGAGAILSGNLLESGVAAKAMLVSTPEAGRSKSAPGCVDGNTVLCVGGRFQVEASWQTASGASGPAYAVPLTSESGYFWFLEPSNVEVFVKTLDSCALSRGHWIFATGSTNLGVDLRVTDTFTDEVRTYVNPIGSSFAPVQDTEAFSFCQATTILTSESSHTLKATRTPTATNTPTENHAPKPTHSPRPPRPTATSTPTPIQIPTRTPKPPKPRHTPTPTPTQTSTPAPPTQTPTPTFTPSPTSTPGPPQTYTVTLGCSSQVCFGSGGSRFSVYQFSPRTIHVRVGDTVSWTWPAGQGPSLFQPACSGVHSITSGTPSAPHGQWNSGTQTGPFTFSHTFTQAGTFPYFCTPGHEVERFVPATIRGYCVSQFAHETGTVIVDP